MGKHATTLRRYDATEEEDQGWDRAFSGRLLTKRVIPSFIRHSPKFNNKPSLKPDARR